jgi:phenylacetic acid degradation operon negative regulatory protein
LGNGGDSYGDDAPAPSLSRRRQVSSTSARSMLLAMLGEYVLPTGEKVWTSVLVRALALLDVEEKAARQALTRTAAEGLLAAERRGRRARWSLTEAGGALLADQTRQLHMFGGRRDAWDGRWLILLVSVPESQRRLRHRLRTQLTWAGLGLIAPGVWVTPDPGREARATAIVHELGLQPLANSFVGRTAQLGQVDTLVEQAWDLPGLARQYDNFVASFRSMNPSSPDAVLRAHTLLVHDWRRFPHLDPQLPAELLPRRWSGAAAAALFHDLHASWRDNARARWAELARRPQ